MVDFNFNNYSMAVLRLETLDRLSTSLNPKKRLRSADGRLRDWSGLADLAQLTPDERRKVESAYKNDYTRSIISIWCNKTDVTVAHLVDALEAMDRHDAVEDSRHLLVDDCRAAAVAMTASITDVRALDKTNALTLQDVEALASGKPLVRYDAMVLFGEADEDMAFGSHLIQRCEDAGLKVFVPQRDLVAGTVEHETSSKIISERCRKVIAVFSPSFLSSERNMFLTGFAQHIGIMDGKNDKIIPIILRDCTLPVQYQMYHKVKYDPSRRYINFWDKLLRVTFEVRHLPESLKTYDFFLSSEGRDGHNPSVLGQQSSSGYQSGLRTDTRITNNASTFGPRPLNGRMPVDTGSRLAGWGRAPAPDGHELDTVSSPPSTIFDDAASVITNETQLSVAQLVNVGSPDSGSSNLEARLPNPPQEDPDSPASTSSVRSDSKPKSKIMRQIKDRIKGMGTKKVSEPQQS